MRDDATDHCHGLSRHGGAVDSGGLADHAFVVGEDGPGDIVVRIRRLAGDGFWGRVLDCFYCLSLWVAIPFAVITGGGWPERVIAWFGLSGGAILLERITTREAVSPPSSTQHTENPNVMLR